jgi:uncharacterized repeat protein (TIGR02059 family)
LSLALSSDGRTVAIGADYNDGSGVDAGHVRIYQLNGDAWVQLGADIDGEAAEDFSGTSVALSSDGRTVAIGAPGNDGNDAHHSHTDSSENTYDPSGNYLDSSGSYPDSSGSYPDSSGSYPDSSGSYPDSSGSYPDSSGSYPDSSGSYPDSSGSYPDSSGSYPDSSGSYPDSSGSYADTPQVNSGHVRVYQLNGDAWIQLGGDIDGEAAEDHSGTSVALSSDGRTVAIGAPDNNGSDVDSGHVRIYQLNGVDEWEQLGGDIDGQAADEFSGYSVALSSDGQTVAIGAPDYSDASTEGSGNVRVYQLNSGAWVQLGADIDGGVGVDYFGYSVSLSNDGRILAAGADYNGTDSNYGVRLYHLNDDIQSWELVDLSVHGDAVFGQSVSLSGDGQTLAVGSPYFGDSGEVRVFGNNVDNNSEPVDPAASHDDYPFVLDASFLSSPQIIATLSDNQDGFNHLKYPRDITTTVINDVPYALVAAPGDQAVQILDLSDPHNPQNTSQLYDLQTNHPPGSHGFSTLANPHGLRVIEINGDSFVIVAAWGDDGISIINISDPSSPTLASSLLDNQSGFDELDKPHGIAVAEIGGNFYAFIASKDDNGIQIIDISDPYQPVAAASLSDGGQFTLGQANRVSVAQAGSKTVLLVAAKASNAIQIIDVTDPANPSSLSVVQSINSPDEIKTIDIDGRQYAFAVSKANNSVQIIEFTDPINPVKGYKFQDGVDGFNRLAGVIDVDLVTDGVSAYALFVSQTDNSITAADITDPSAPVYISSFNATAPRHIDSLFINNKVYGVVATNSQGGVSIVELGSYVDEAADGTGDTAPTFTSAETSADGTQVVLTYDVDLDSITADISAFAVTSDGAANDVIAVDISGSTVELTLVTPVENGQTVSVTYSDPTASDDANAIQALSNGADAASFSDEVVTNNSTLVRPAAPSAPDLLATSDTGNSDSDNLTSDTTPSFSGTAEASSTVEVFADGVSLGFTAADANGDWTFTVADTDALADGSYSITARAMTSSEDGSPKLITTPNPVASPYRTTQEWGNWYAFAALKEDGSVITWWGYSDYGGDSSSVSAQLQSDVAQIFATGYSFAALKEDGSVITWGDSRYGGDSSSVSSDLQSGVSRIFSTPRSFAALKEDGSVIAWGDSTWGGDSSSVSAHLQSGVAQIFSTGYSFAALKEDGSVITWGDSNNGGDSSSVSSELQSGVAQIFSTGYSFAALKEDGSVITWGNSDSGGNSSGVSAQLQSAVAEIFSNEYSFAALKEDGSVITWGDFSYGGNSSSISDQISSGVSQIFSNKFSFAALKEDGSVITWGYLNNGGDSSSVSAQLQSGVAQIFATESAFAALKEDGSVITWGLSSWGGDSSSVNSQLQSGVAEIFSSGGSFAALKEDGSVVTWGYSSWGGDSSSVSSQLQSGVAQIFANSSAFAALKDDGSVITWGHSNHGGDSSSVSSDLQSGVVSFADPFHDDRLVSVLTSDPSPALVLTIDTVPTLTAAETSTDGSQVVLTYDVDLDSTTADTSAFEVTINSAVSDVIAVDISGSTVELTLENHVGSGQTVSVTYSDPTAGDDANAIQALSHGADAASFSNEVVTNNSTLVPPAAPSAPDLIAASDTGNSDSDNLTNDTTPSLSGTAEVGSTVEVFADGVSLGSTTADANGDWTFTVADTNSLADGSYSITATATAYSVDSPVSVHRTPIPGTSSWRTTQEVKNPTAFAALKEDGSVITWGDSWYGGDSSNVSGQLQSGVAQIFSNKYSFAALKEDGSVITWGDPNKGGDSSSVSNALQSGVSQVFSTGRAFAALKEDGSVITLGDSDWGGDSSSVSNALQSGVAQIFSNYNAFAALKDDGSVITWGDSTYGGDSSSVSAQLQSGVSQIFSTLYAFVALKGDGSVITWGGSTYGGDSSSVSPQLQSGVSQIFSTNSAFAALKEDGSVISWGNDSWGGDSSSVSAQLQSGVAQIFSTGDAFAALKDDGSVITWGRSDNGGDSSSVSAQLSSGVVQIFSNDAAFAALKDDGSVITWGHSNNGGDSSSVSAQLQSGVAQIFATEFAFAALKEDGSVITWGDSTLGGDSSSVSNDLQSGVSQIFSTISAFSALKEDGSVVTWGSSDRGGNSSSVSAQLQSGVVSFADPFHDDRLVAATTGIELTSDPSPALALMIESIPPTFISAETSTDGRILLHYDKDLSGIKPPNSAFVIHTDGVIGGGENYSDSFSTLDANGWITGNSASRYDLGGEQIFGRFAQGDSVSRRIDLNGGSSTVSFDFYRFDTWDGESFIISGNGEEIFSKSIRNPNSVGDEFSSSSSGTFYYSIEPLSSVTNLGGLSNHTDEKLRFTIYIPEGLQHLDLELTSTLDEDVNNESWAIDNFVVEPDGTSIESISTSGSTVELALSQPIENDQTVTIAYNDPSAADDANAIQDLAGNDADDLPDQVVINNSTMAGTAPILMWAEAFSVVDTGISLSDGAPSSGLVSSIDAVIPNGYNANWSDIYSGYGSGGDAIDDGGDDMYDGGNMISTNLGGGLSYNYNSLQIDLLQFGQGSKSKVVHGSSFWMLAVENSQASYVQIDGNTGADGHGRVVTSELVLGDYRVFVKHINDEYKYQSNPDQYTEDDVDLDPSINHIFIVKNTGLHTQDFSLDTDDDYHQISGFEPGEDFVYALIAGDRGYQYSEAELQSIAQTIINESLSSSSGEGNVVVLNFEQPLADVVPPVSAFEVTAGDKNKVVTSVSISDRSLTLHLDQPIKNDDEVRVVYTDPGANGIQDLEGNTTAAFDTADHLTYGIDNFSTVPGTPPEFVSAEANSSGQVILTYNEDLDDVPISPSAFEVFVDYHPNHDRSDLVTAGLISADGQVNAAPSHNSVTTELQFRSLVTLFARSRGDSPSFETVTPFDDTFTNGINASVGDITFSWNVSVHGADSVAGTGPHATRDGSGLNFSDRELQAMLSLGTLGSADRTGVSLAVNSVDVDGQSVVLTLDTPVENDQAVAVTYTNPGTSETVSDQRSYAQFDGIDNTLETGVKPIPATGDFTVSVWAKTDSASISGLQEIFSQGQSGNAFYLGTQNSIIRVGDSWSSSGHYYPSDGNWHNLQVTVSSGTATLYLDGVELGQQNNFVNPSGGTDLIVGRQYGTHTEYWNGGIDDLIVFNRALSPDELHDVREGHHYYSPDFHIEFDGDFTATYQDSSITATSASPPTLSAVDTTGIGYPIRDPQGNDAVSLSTQSDEWSVVYATGTFGDISYDESSFNESFRATPNHIVKRECDGCDAGYEEIYYKRLTHLDTFNIGYVLVDSWMSSVDGLPNILGEDFNIYSTYEDALAGTNAWSYCNYDDPGVGFPRDCGIDGASGSQWSSLSRSGQSNIRFSTEPANDAGIVVTNNSDVTGTAPTFISAETTTDGRILLHYSEELGDTTAPNSAFLISTNGTGGNVELYSDSFTTSDANGWNSTARYNLGGEQIFGRFARGNTINRTIVLNGGAATISFDFYRFDSWDAESFIIRGNGEQIFSRSFRHDSNLGNESGSSSSGTFDYSIEPLTSNTHLGSAHWTDQKLRFTITVPAGLSDLDLEFTSTLDQDAGDESWAIDNFVVEADGTSVSSVSNSGNTVELTLTMPIENDQDVTIAYTDPSDSDDLNATQDPHGNDVETFVPISVQNNSTVAGTPPSLSSATTSADGFSVVLFFDQELSTTIPSASGFAVTAGGSNIDLAAGTKAFTTSGDVEWCVIYDYDDSRQAYRIGIDKRQFPAGFNYSELNQLSLLDLWDGQISYESDDSAWAEYWIHTETPLDFSGSQYLADIRDSGGSYGIRVDFSFTDLEPIVITGPSEITLRLTDGIKNDQEIRVIYTDPGSGGIQDPEGNATADFDSTDIANVSSIPGTPPVFVSAEVNSSGQIVLTYNEDLGSTTASTSDFVVTADSHYRVEGSAPVTVQVNSAFVSGSTVVLTLVNPIENDQAVSVAYKHAGAPTVDVVRSVDTMGWQQLGSDINGEAAGDQAGVVSLSADGRTLAIGAHNNHPADGDPVWYARPGHVRIYQLNDSDQWVQIDDDIDGAYGDSAGWSVSLSGDGNVVAIGYPRWADYGFVRLYENLEGSWQQIGSDIRGEHLGDTSAQTISLSSDGTTVAIGSIYNDDAGTNAGHVRVFSRNESDQWVQVGSDIDGEASNDYSGGHISLSSDGSMVAVGATNNNGSGEYSGHVRVYQLDQNEWAQVGSDIDGEAPGDHSGVVSLSSDGRTVAIGAPNNSDSGFRTGHVRVYQLNTVDQWTQLGGDIDGEVDFDFNSGASVSLSSDGRTVAIGAAQSRGTSFRAGHTRVYTLNQADEWVQVGAYLHGEEDDLFGHSVSLSSDGQTVAISAQNGDSASGTDSGYIQVYQVGNTQQPLQGSVELTDCTQSWSQNYVGINLDFYQANNTEFAVGAKVEIAGYDYWIDAVNIPTNCDQGVALIYVADSPGSADGNAWTIGGAVVDPVVPGDQWRIIDEVIDEFSESYDVQHAIQDPQGNDALSVSIENVTNNSNVAGTAPTFISAETTTDGRVIVHYSEELSSIAASASAFDVSANSFWRDPESTYQRVSVSSVSVDGSSIELTLDDPLENDQKVKFAYIDPSGGNDGSAVQDPEGNDVASIDAISLDNISTLAGTPPLLPGQQSTGQFSSDFIERVSSSESVSALNSAITNGYSTNWSGSYYISDGGNDMYDHGNMISTNLASNLNYNYNSLQSDSSHFGSGSRHKIFHGTSFWMLAVENSQATRVQIDGNNGADNNGSVHALNFERGDYKVFIKHVNDGRGHDPSINHIFIVRNTGNHIQDYATNTDNDYHRIIGFEPGEDFIYTLVAGNGAYQYSQEQYEGIVDAILDAAGAGLSTGIVGGNGATDFEITEDGLSLIVHFNEELQDTPPSPDQFSISHEGFEYGPRFNSVTSLNISGSDLTLNLAEPVRNDEPITLSYTDLSVANDAVALQDLEGNDVPSFTSTGFLNLSRVGGTAPVFESIDTTEDGRIVLTYDQALDSSFLESDINQGGFRHPASDSIDPTSFTVSIDSASIDPTNVLVDSVVVDGNTITLSLPNPIENDQLVSVAYLDPTDGDDRSAIQDPQGQDVSSLASTDVENRSIVPGTPPSFERVETTLDGRILLHYSEPLSASVASPSNFDVIVNSHWRDGTAYATSVDVASVTTDGNTVELILSSPVENDQTVTVAYSDPSGANDTNAIQDPAGNDVLPLATTTVANSSTVPGTLPVVPDDEVLQVSPDGLSIRLPFSEHLSTTLPSVDQFTISHLGFEYEFGTNEVTAVSVDDKDLTLTLSQPIRNDQPITLSYNDLTSDSVLPQIDILSSSLSSADASEFGNSRVQVGLTSEGGVLVFGDDDSRGADISSVSHLLESGVIQVYSHSWGFAALKDDGQVVTWGGYSGGVRDYPAQGRSARTIVSSGSAFVALLDDGSIDAWGNAAAGGSLPSELNGVTDIQTVVSIGWGFAALLGNGEVVSWGSAAYASDPATNPDFTPGSTRVVDLVSGGSFAALRDDGTVAHWAGWVFNNDTTANAHNLANSFDWNGSNDDLYATAIYPSNYGIAVVRNDSSIVAFGRQSGAGLVNIDNTGLTIDRIVGGERSFAALRSDGSVIAWGNNMPGGVVSLDPGSSDVRQPIELVYSGSQYTDAYAVLFDDGTVQSFGHNAAGGGSLDSYNLNGVNGDLEIISLKGGGKQFSVLRSDGSVVTWGDSAPSESTPSILSSGVAQLVRSNLALMDDGSFVIFNVNEVSHKTSAAPLIGLNNPLTDDQYVLANISGNDAAALQDPEGNDVLSFSVDRYLNLSDVTGTSPALQNVETTDDGRIVLTFDQKLDSSYGDSENFDDGFRNPISSLIDTAAFEVSVNSPAIDRTIVPVDDVLVDGATVTLTLSDAVENDHDTTVAYTDPSSSNDSDSLQDRQGNDVSSISDTSVVNLSTVPGTPPTFVSAALLPDGYTLELLYSEPLGVTTASADSFEVISGERVKGITDVAIDGKTLSLTFENFINDQQKVILSYEDPSAEDDGDAVQDPAGNDVSSLVDISVSNLSSIRGDGLVEGTDLTGYKFIHEPEPVQFSYRSGITISDSTSEIWDVVEALPSDSGFDVLLYGSRKGVPWYRQWTANVEGVLVKTRPWVHQDDMASSGYEDHWNLDIDGNGVIGEAPFQDSDSNGLADYKVRYTVLDGDDHIILTNRGGFPLTNSSSDFWDVVFARPYDFKDPGYEVIIEAQTPEGLRYSSRQANANGRIDRLLPFSSQWKTGEQFMRLGYEEAFVFDFNGDGEVGMPQPEDNDDNGLVDGGGDYRLIFGSEVIDVRTKYGLRYSDLSNTLWDATKAVQNGVDFKVLIEGVDILADRYKVWNVGSDGVITKISRWFTVNEMVAQDYELSFGRDFNSDGYIGEPPVVDADGDGLVDGSINYRLFHDDSVITLVDTRGRSYSDATNRWWDATTAVVDGDGFDVLLEGNGRYDGRYRVWDVSSDGVRLANTGWLSVDQMMSKGYEVTFDRDFNEDGYIGEPPIVDADGDGFVDGGGDYRLLLFVDDPSVSSSAQASTSMSLLRPSPNRTHQEWRNLFAFAALKEDGSVITWGGAGGDSSSVSAQLQSGVSQIFSAGWAFAALKEDGSVITWGDSYFGGDSSSVSAQLQSGVSQIFSNYGAFAALKDDGSVITWGVGDYGGDSSSVSSQLQSGVSQIFSSYDAFAALKEDGSVITWGGAGGDSSSVSAELQSGVSQIFSSYEAFAALKEDGSVITWGDSTYGGDSSSVSEQLQSGVAQIFSNGDAFAALKENGSVITWGSSSSGGDSSSVSNDLQSGVAQIFSTEQAFAALKEDGSVITWGNSDRGGDSSFVRNDLQSGVSQIFSSHLAFAALKDDGSVITWGDSTYGGDSGSVSADLQSDVAQIFSTNNAFAALKEDGSVITWGSGDGGGDSSSVSVSDELQSGVAQIFSNEYSFAALKEDGSVITWGSSSSGGDSSSVSAELQSGVFGIASPFDADIRTNVPVKTATAITLTNRRGWTYSDASNRWWDATTAVINDDGFDVLLEGNGRYDGLYRVWDVSADGVRLANTGWLSVDQMMAKGYEVTFDRDFNGDGFMGEPPIVDADRDGFVDGGGEYRLFVIGSAAQADSEYSGYPIVRGDSMYTIVDGQSWSTAQSNARALGGNLVTINDSDENTWLHDTFDIGADGNLFWTGYSDNNSEGNWRWVSGEISSYTNWQINQPNNANISSTYGENYMNLGLFGSSSDEWNDFPDVLVPGEPYYGDWLNHRGIAEIPLHGQLMHDLGLSDPAAVTLTDHLGRTYSDASNRWWDATTAVPDGDGFDVLLEGTVRRADQYQVWDVGSDGVRSGMTRWLSPDQMMFGGYEVTFTRDFNSDGYIGQPPVADADFNGFVDGDGDYQIFHNDEVIDLTDRRGGRYSDATNFWWDATTAIADGDGFDVLLEGIVRFAGQYQVWDVGADGVLSAMSSWLNADQMMSMGYEVTFERDFNDDGYIGEPPIVDVDRDGFADGDGDYRLFYNDSAIPLKDNRGGRYSDATNRWWDATTAVRNGDGFEVLLEGSVRLAGQYQVWDVDADGVVSATSTWLTADQLMKQGYETVFSRDFNDDGITGIPPVVDSNVDGIVDGDGFYSLYRQGEAVDLVTQFGGRYSDATNSLWDVTQSVITEDGFNVLLEGMDRLDGLYLVWEVDSEGVIGRSHGWSSSQDLSDKGFGDLFT